MNMIGGETHYGKVGNLIRSCKSLCFCSTLGAYRYVNVKESEPPVKETQTPF